MRDALRRFNGGRAAHRTKRWFLSTRQGISTHKDAAGTVIDGKSAASMHELKIIMISARNMRKMPLEEILRLDGKTSTLPDVGSFSTSYVRKEAVLSGLIERRASQNSQRQLGWGGNA
jgi:hypothetical protein